ncbi:MAG TPA: ribonuclease J [Candidatus Microsaccharimonas sp.]|jgi:ribonuclease J
MKKEHIHGVTQVTRQKTERIEQLVKGYRPLMAKAAVADPTKIRITPLGGQDGIGEKNMIVVEYGNDAIILDCGFELGIDLPGINYAIPVTDYLKTIKHKIRGYVISHGHMDHIGGLVHIVPEFPAPIYGSQFTIGMVEAQFDKQQDASFQLATHVIDMDEHERVTLGSLTIELVRVTHAIPESSAIVVDTPVGRLINTGDFRLDPEPLDAKPSDIARLKQLGDEGVLLLMSESTNTTKLGRTPTEHTLQDSFYELVGKTKGRLIVAVFSTNMNRVQMIINAAHHYGRQVALDGRSMMTVAELAVRLGNLKIPKGVLVPMRGVNSIPDEGLIIICTGGQGEPGAALSRMAAGTHRSIALNKNDTVVISSTPIPGNEQRYAEIGDYLARMNVKQYRHPTHAIDGSGPLHVSGHGSRDEHKEMIELTRPQFLMPIYGGALPRLYHKGIGLATGIAEQHIIMADNGAFTELDSKQITSSGTVSAGALLVDQTGMVVPEIVTKDRLLLMEDGFIVVVLTIDKNGRLLTSPDILTRGHVAVKENPELLNGLRTTIKKVLAKRTKVTSRTAIDTLKNDLRRAVSDYTYAQTRLTPIVIPVVNSIGLHGETNQQPRPVADVH